jgi:hypothetical protein
LIHVLRGEHDEAARLSRAALADNLDDRWGSDLYFLRVVRDAALDAGNVQEILELYRDRAPQAFAENPEVSFANAGYATDAILPLQYAGEHDAAERIADATLSWYKRSFPVPIYGYDVSILNVELLALDGQEDLALQRLQEAMDSGWLLDWQITALGRNLESLRGRPDFQALIARLESRTNEQLASWLAVPYIGETDLRDPPTK